MDIAQYYELTQKTRNKSLSDDQWLLNCIIGLVGETHELENEFILRGLTKNIKSELGDCFYYYTNILYTLYKNEIDISKFNSKVDFTFFINKDLILTINLNTLFHTLYKDEARVCECIKKMIFHKKNAGTSLMDYLMGIFYNLSHLLCISGFSLSEVLEANIEKLKERYPKGFNA